MNPVRPLVRRIATVSAAVLIGTLATFVLATPASAHKSGATPVVDCTDGQYNIEWTVTNSQSWDATLLVAKFSPSGSSDKIKVGATLPGNGSSAKLKGIQTVPGTTKHVTLTIQASWKDPDGKGGFKTWSEAPHDISWDLAGDCKANLPSPHASAVSACDGSVEVSLTNDGTAATNFVVTAGSFTQTTANLAPDATALKVVVPAANASSIDVSSHGANLGHFGYDPPEGCSPFTVTSQSDCTTLNVLLENPAGNAPITATVSSGNSPDQKFTIGGGEKKTVSFPAGAGTTATVTYAPGAAAAAKVAAAAAADATKPIVVTWTAPAAAACAPPNLPVTGSKIGPIVIAGLAFLVVGAGLLFYLRRRRATPTAA